MEIDPKNSDVFQLLEKLKQANGTYPPELLALRRQGYLRQVAEIGGGAGLALALKNTAKGGAKGTALPPVAGSVLEGILVVAIVAEAGAVTYFYRDKLANLFRRGTDSPKVEEVANPPVISSPIPGVEFTLTPVVTVTQTATALSTPSPLFAEQPTQSGTGPNDQNSQTQTTQGGSPAVSTAAVNDNTNQGNHYGNTPIPQRTKDSGNTNNDTTNTNTQTKPNKKP
jgi:hypothetical protein